MSAETSVSVQTSPATRECRLYDLLGSPVAYHAAWELQHSLMEERRKQPDTPDALVILEHQPVYTLGTASALENVLFDAEAIRRGQMQRDNNTPLLVRTERGGEVTYHGPGQLVAYPILNLTRHKKDLHWYLRALEQVVINMIADEYGLQAHRKEGLTGVWIGDTKVCALGLKVSRWITMHGLALNVCTDLAPFKRIIPCGVSDYSVSSLHLLGGDRDIQRARDALLQSFCSEFGPFAFTEWKR